jgi:hypothetical protein
MMPIIRDQDSIDSILSSSFFVHNTTRVPGTCTDGACVRAERLFAPFFGREQQDPRAERPRDEETIQTTTTA